MGAVRRVAVAVAALALTAGCTAAAQGPTDAHSTTAGIDHSSMPGMDHSSMAGMTHDHSGTAMTADATPNDRPRALVLGAFAAVNGFVLTAAGMRRRLTPAPPRRAASNTAA